MKRSVTLLTSWPLAFFLLSSCGRPTAQPTPVVEPKPAAMNVIGSVIEFGEGGASEIYRVSGWSESAKRGMGFTWSKGTSAKLALPIPVDSGAVTLKIKMGGLFHPPDLPFQPIEVYANGQKISDLRVSTLADFNVLIPPTVPNPEGMIEIEFRIPKAISPKALGKSSDERDLGIFVVQIQPIKQG